MAFECPLYLSSPLRRLYVPACGRKDGAAFTCGDSGLGVYSVKYEYLASIVLPIDNAQVFMHGFVSFVLILPFLACTVAHGSLSVSPSLSTPLQNLPTRTRTNIAGYFEACTQPATCYQM